jgi:photosystem II stability/assembly factor-like uncharacterized protein
MANANRYGKSIHLLVALLLVLSLGIAAVPEAETLWANPGTIESENSIADCIVQAADSELGIFAPLGNITASPVHNAAVWVVGDSSDGYGTILYTTDGGNTWERQGSVGEIPNVTLGSVSAVDSSTAWVVGYNGTILHTTDGGNTWTRQGEGEIPDVDLLKVSAVDRNTAWVVGYNGTILHTTDGGNTWEQQGGDTIPDVLLQGVCAVDYETVWATGKPSDNYATILHTTDGGNTWERQGSAAELPDGHFLGVSAADGNNAWAVGGPGGTIFHTTNGGNTWVDQTPDNSVWSDANEVFAIDANTAWVVQDYGNIFYTENGGENWTRQSANASSYLLMGVSAIDDNTAWVVGVSQLGGVILHTTNGGNTWQPQTPPVNPNFWGVSFAPPPTPPVGGQAYPVSRMSLLAPWIAVAVALAGGISWYASRLRMT